jgi:hypothetical protein
MRAQRRQPCAHTAPRPLPPRPGRQAWWRVAYPAHARLAAWALGSARPGALGGAAAALAVLAEGALPVYLLSEHQFTRLRRKLFDAALAAATGAPAPAPASGGDAAALAAAADERRRRRAAAAAEAARAQARGGGGGRWLGSAARLARGVVMPEAGEPKRVKLLRRVALARSAALWPPRGRRAHAAALGAF